MHQYSSFLLRLKDKEKMRQFHQKRKVSFRLEKGSYILRAIIYDEEYIPKAIRRYVTTKSAHGLSIYENEVVLEKKVPSQNLRKELIAFHKEAAIFAQNLLEIENSHLITS